MPAWDGLLTRALGWGTPASLDMNRSHRSIHPPRTLHRPGTPQPDPHDRSLSRRMFGRAVVGLPVLAAGCGQAQAPSSVRMFVATIQELEAGEPIAFELAEVGQCFAVMLDTEAEQGVGPARSIVAFSTVCPHMGCPIGMGAVDSATGQFGPCGCHQSVFDLRRDGRMVHGCAAANLARVGLELEGDDLYATGIVGLAFGQPLTESDALTTIAQATTAGED